MIGCTGDWTGGWDCSEPGGADLFITPDLQKGRVVDVIARGEPAVMVCHWTGIYYNGRETGFTIFREVVSRLRQRYGQQLLWMKLGEIARYAAAKELTRIERSADGRTVTLKAPFACPQFTLRVTSAGAGAPAVSTAGAGPAKLDEVNELPGLRPGTFLRAKEGGAVTVCFPLARGESRLQVQ